MTADIASFSKRLQGMACLLMALAMIPAIAWGDVKRHESSLLKYPQASLQAQAVAEVAQDTVRITLVNELSKATQQEAARALNVGMARAMGQAKKAPDSVKVSSGDYRVWPVSNKEGHITNWRGRAEMHIESSDFEAASSLAAELENDLAIASLSFFVSPKLRAQQEALLLEQAAQAFRDRAQALAKSLGYENYRLRTVQLGGAGAHYEAAPRMVQAQAAMFKAEDAVPLEGTTETIRLTIEGTVFLLHDNTETSQLSP